jgi:hypothetical protein
VTFWWPGRWDPPPDLSARGAGDHGEVVPRVSSFPPQPGCEGLCHGVCPPVPLCLIDNVERLLGVFGYDLDDPF